MAWSGATTEEVKTAWSELNLHPSLHFNWGETTMHEVKGNRPNFENHKKEKLSSPLEGVTKHRQETIVELSTESLDEHVECAIVIVVSCVPALGCRTDKLLV